MNMTASECVFRNCVNGIELEIMMEKILISKLQETRIDILNLNDDLEKEYLNILKLLKIIAHMEYGLKKLHSIQQYEKKVDDFILKCKNHMYGSLEDLLQ
jgi:hypothetical protein